MSAGSRLENVLHSQYYSYIVYPVASSGNRMSTWAIGLRQQDNSLISLFQTTMYSSRPCSSPEKWKGRKFSTSQIVVNMPCKEIHQRKRLLPFHSPQLISHLDLEITTLSSLLEKMKYETFPSCFYQNDPQQRRHSSYPEQPSTFHLSFPKEKQMSSTG